MGLHTATLAQPESLCIGVGTGAAEERDLGARRRFRSVLAAAIEGRADTARPLFTARVLFGIPAARDARLVR